MTAATREYLIDGQPYRLVYRATNQMFLLRSRHDEEMARSDDEDFMAALLEWANGLTEERQ